MRRSVKTIVAGVAVTLSLAGLAACGSDSDSGSGADPKASATPAAEKADLTGIPAVVAVVNDQEILKDEFVTAYESQFKRALQDAQTSGQPVDQKSLKKQTADGLVSNKLLLAEADRRKFTATPAAVEKSLTDYAKQSGVGTPEAYLKALADQGIDEAQVRSELQVQVKLDQLLAEEAGNKKPTKAELQALYDQAVAQQAQSGTAGQPAQQIPPFEQVQSQLKEQAQAQKESAAADALLTKLRKTAKITVNI